MDVDGDNGILANIAAGDTLELDAWPALQMDILARLEKIAHTEFAVPDLPPPRQLRRSLDNGEHASSSPLPEPSSQEADKENVPAPAADSETENGANHDDKEEGGDDKPKDAPTTEDNDTVMEKVEDEEATAAEKKPDEEETTQTNVPSDAAANASSGSIAADDSSSAKLPIQLAAMLGDIKSHIQTFVHAPPHTLQRLAELILHPRAHYRALATYLHAVDRVVQVTSGLNTYPLPPAIPDMSSIRLNGVVDTKDPAASVNWSNPTTGVNSSTSETSAAAAAAAAVAVGSDEALGGALLTPIPWLTRRSPDNGDAASSSSGGGSTAGGSGSGAQIHSESTETIEGPNGVGSIETVSVSVNGVPSTGHARGVTQGELLRQEQRAGVVPVSQLSRTGGHPQQQQHAMQQQQQQQQQQHHQQPLRSQHAGEGGSPGKGDEDGDDGEPRPMDEDGAAATDERREDDEQDRHGEGGGEVEEEELPHVRGPDEIGVDDTGLQTATTSSMGEGGLDVQGIDLAAAVGRPPEEEEHHEPKRTPEKEKEVKKDENDDEEEEEVKAPQSPESTGTKREAEDAAEGEPSKKMKEE